MPDILKVAVFSAVAYLSLFIIAKLLGKKQIAQLSFIDYVVGITIGSIAAEMATETEAPFYNYLLAMGLFFLFDLAITFISRKGKLMKTVFSGKPLTVIENGQINFNELKKSKISVEELTGMARDKDYFDLDDIAFAVLETSGKLSILPKAEKQPVVCENIGVTLPAPSLTEYLVIDGSVCDEAMKTNGYSEEWLLSGLHLSSKKELKNVLLAYYDSEKKVFHAHFKEAVEAVN